LLGEAKHGRGFDLEPLGGGQDLAPGGGQAVARLEPVEQAKPQRLLERPYPRATVDWLTFSVSAAASVLPARATARKWRRSFQSIHVLCNNA
jgi:hypothetical protein